MKKQKGFTLIELLVVIAIIAILSTVVMAGLNSARAKGRDARRLSDIKQLQSALELCFDNGAGYPVGASTVIGATGASLRGDTACTAVGAPTTILFGSYMNPLPTNPLPGGADYTYAAATSDTYAITFKLEGQSGSLPGGVSLTASPSGIITTPAP